MAEEGIDGTETPAPETPAWIAQLPDDLKGNETFTPFKTLGDFGKSHLELVEKAKELDGISAKSKEFEEKLTNSIPKLSENSTDEEKAAFYKALGRPEKPEEYEFPKGDDVEHDPKMISWAQSVFHQAGLSKQQAAMIGQQWDAFMKGMVEAEEKITEDTKKENEAKFRAEFKSDEEFKAGMELTKRFWKKVTDTDFDEAYKEAEAWQIPVFMKFLFTVSQAIGEDWSPKGASPTGGEVMARMKYKDMDHFGAT